MDDEDRYTRITLRIPRELHHVLSKSADQGSKSLNAEIIGRLDGSFSDQQVIAELSLVRRQLSTADALIRNLSEGFVALYDRAHFSGDEQLRRLYVTCKARLSNDPEEIEALVRDEPDGAEMQSLLVKMASRVRAQNERAEARHKALRDTIAVRAKRMEGVARAEELAVKMALQLLLGEAKLPGLFEDYPPKAWVDATGLDFDTVLGVAREAGPTAEAVRVALKSRLKD